MLPGRRHACRLGTLPAAPWHSLLPPWQRRQPSARTARGSQRALPAAATPMAPPARRQRQLQRPRRLRRQQTARRSTTPGELAVAGWLGPGGSHYREAAAQAAAAVPRLLPRCCCCCCLVQAAALPADHFVIPNQTPNQPQPKLPQVHGGDRGAGGRSAPAGPLQVGRNQEAAGGQLQPARLQPCCTAAATEQMWLCAGVSLQQHRLQHCLWVCDAPRLSPPSLTAKAASLACTCIALQVGGISELLAQRSAVDLKDKWRNLVSYFFDRVSACSCYAWLAHTSLGAAAPHSHNDQLPAS